ncbi:tetraspanin 37 [Plectropomus leopardus]|uniref:tetraspanin 37 n=1 Tax=Plectropomus leopardus TaxID=160734 RepID=UPI001C4CFEA9|nr:tetraspanin 37 [Plectropomus leopardus]
MSDERRKTLKTILQLTSQLLWVVGLVVGLSGVYLLMYCRQSSVFFSHSYIMLPAVVTLASASFLLVSGFLGSWLSLRDSTFLQGLFVFLLVFVFCLESTASALAYFHSTQLHSEISPLSAVFKNYTGSSQDPNSRAVDAAQEELQCCGVSSYRDWLETSWFNRTGGLWVPHSCCNNTFSFCNGTVDQPWLLNTPGCQVKLESSLQFVLSFIIWGLPLVFLVEVVLFVTVGQLMKNQSLMDYQILEKH